MATDNEKDSKFKAHTEALAEHQQLLTKLHLDSNIRLDEINQSLERLTITLEEYLKVIGIP
jgi:hypothetical protein